MGVLNVSPNEVVGTQLRLQPSNRSTGLDIVVGLGAAPLTPAALQGNIFIDPQNLSGNAGTGAGFGSSAAAPLSSYQALATLWGTVSPFLNQNTVLIFISPHTDNTDPVVFTPYVAAGVSVSITSTPTTVATGVVLAGTVPKSRVAGSNSLLQTTLSAAVAVAELVVNTTHPSVAATYKSLGANAFSMTQPFVAAAVPPALQTTVPAEVDTWTNGDTVNVLAPLNVNIVVFAPQIVDWNATRTNAGTLYRVTVFDPQGAGKDTVTLGSDVLISECFFQRTLSLVGSPTSNAFTVGAGGGPFGYPTSLNTQYLGGWFCDGGFRIIGGCFLGFSAFAGSSTTANGIVDGDCILGSTFIVASGVVTFAFVALDSGAANNIAVGASATATAGIGSFGGRTLYGRAGCNIQVNGKGRLQINGGTAATALTYPVAIATGVLINTAAFAQSHTNTSPDVITSAVATTVANIDASTGGLFNLTGGQISTTG